MGGPYKLKNGLVISEVKFTPPKELNRGSVTTQEHPSSPSTRMPILLFSTSDSVDGNGSPTVASYQISAQVKTQGWSAQHFRDIDIRFIQFCEVKRWETMYAGKKSSDGMVIRAARGGLTSLFLDCLTDRAATAAVNFPYYNLETTAQMPPAYFPMMNDTPGSRFEGDIYNGASMRNNYFWKFWNLANFTSMVVVVHKDGSREVLEGWEWSLKRELTVRWANRLPVVVSSVSELKPAAQGGTFVGDIRRSIAMEPAGVKVVNVEFNNAILNIHSNHHDLFYFERLTYDEQGEMPPADFWT